MVSCDVSLIPGMLEKIDRSADRRLPARAIVWRRVTVAESVVQTNRFGGIAPKPSIRESLMRRWKTAAFGAAMLAAGYLLGATGAWESGHLTAQDAGVTSTVKDRIAAANDALQQAAEALKSEGQYVAATEGVNAFLVLSGGGDAQQDLESGTGVDPETFAALYAEQALPEIQAKLERDADNRLTYNGKVVQMYSKSRLQRLYAERLKLTMKGIQSGTANP